MKIAVFGKTRAGKSTACDAIIDTLSSIDGKENVLELDFSKALREVVGVLYPETRFKKDRNKLIEIGQHMRKLDENIWVNIVKNSIELSDCDHMVVTGIRQPNEYKALKEKGFIFIKIDCSEETRLERCIKAGDQFSKENLNHDTETYIDEFEYDCCINNDGVSEEVFLKQLKELILSLHLKESFFREKLVKLTWEDFL